MAKEQANGSTEQGACNRQVSTWPPVYDKSEPAVQGERFPVNGSGSIEYLYEKMNLINIIHTQKNPDELQI